MPSAADVPADGDIRIYGSASIVHRLLPHGLIHEFRVMPDPTVLGRGIKLVPNDIPVRLALPENERFAAGDVLLR